jgi:Arc/MetJ-type ribon-helix-helix transcriptional regulator
MLQTCQQSKTGELRKMKLVTVLLPEAYLEGLDELVRSNMYPSRSSAIRSAVRDMLKKELWQRGREE